jgi:hypothetical protein
VHSDQSYGGALLRRDRPGLSSLVYPTYALGDDPHGIWRVEVGDHVLLSDPVALDTGAWTMAALDGVVLREGEWSGTASDFQDQFGVAETYTAGLMTGGCLDSATAYVDTVTRQRAHKIVRDLEPSVWASITWGSPQSGTLTYGDQIRLRTRLVRENLTGDHVYGIVSAHMELWRQYLHRRWEKVTTVRTDGVGKAGATVVAGRSARFQWRRTDGTAISDRLVTRTTLELSRVRVVGHPGDEVTLPRGKRIVVRGWATPGVGPVEVELFRFATVTSVFERARPDGEGRWQVSFPAQPVGKGSIRAYNDPPPRFGFFPDYVFLSYRVR